MNNLKGLIAQIEYLGAKVSVLQGRDPSLHADLAEVLDVVEYAWKSASAAFMIAQEESDAHG